MKLRNKKTGEIVELDYVGVSAKEITLYTINPITNEFCYGSLQAIVEEWEDYEPTEPLIKDEKIRKAVRAWAKLTQATKILTVKRRTSRETNFTEFFSPEKLIALEFLGRFDELEDGKEYYIAELCGEEENAL